MGRSLREVGFVVFEPMTDKQREFLRPILDGWPIPNEQRAYFRMRLEDRLQKAILQAFMQRYGSTTALVDEGIQDLVRRLGMKPFVVRRLIGGGPTKFDQVADIMLALGMDFDDFTFRPIADMAKDKSDEVR